MAPGLLSLMGPLGLFDSFFFSPFDSMRHDKSASAQDYQVRLLLLASEDLDEYAVL